MKQVIIMRKDLNMRKGKMCAQAAHVSIKVLLDRSKHSTYKEGIKINELIIPIKDIREWIFGTFKKVVVGVNSESELFDIFNEAQSSSIPSAMILDSGLTEFKEPTYTCCAIGPHNSDEIDKITGHLKLI